MIVTWATWKNWKRKKRKKKKRERKWKALSLIHSNLFENISNMFEKFSFLATYNHMVGFGKKMNVYLSLPISCKKGKWWSFTLTLISTNFLHSLYTLTHIEVLKNLYTFYLVVDIYVFEIFYIAFAFPKNKRWHKDFGWWMLNC